MEEICFVCEIFDIFLLFIFIVFIIYKFKPLFIKNQEINLDILEHDLDILEHDLESDYQDYLYIEDLVSDDINKIRKRKRNSI